MLSFLIKIIRGPCDGDDRARSSTLCLQLVSRRLGSGFHSLRSVLFSYIFFKGPL